MMLPFVNQRIVSLSKALKDRNQNPHELNVSSQLTLGGGNSLRLDTLDETQLLEQEAAVLL